MDGPLKPQGTWAEKVLGKTYRIVRKLGEGGMGAVYEARHVRLPLRFAVKVLRCLEGSSKEELSLRFRREAELTCQLRHRHIVDVVDYNTTTEGEPYIVMEFLEGETLADRIARRGGLPLGEALSIARQVGAALSAAHLRKVIHRDLKPQNVFLCRHDDRDDYVKVVDFGISKLVGSGEQLTGENTVLGTPAYVAPEQVLGRNAELDSRTDQFALGVMVYEMLTGRVAFAGDSAIKVFYKIVHEEPPPLATLTPGLPPALGEVIGRALAKDPASRYPDVARFIEALEAAGREAVDEGWSDIATSRPVRIGDTAGYGERPDAVDAHAPTRASGRLSDEALGETLPPPELAPARDTTTAMSAAELLPAPPTPRSRYGLLLAGGGLAVGLVAGTLLLLVGRAGPAPPAPTPPSAPPAGPAAPPPRLTTPLTRPAHAPTARPVPDAGRPAPRDWIIRPTLEARPAKRPAKRRALRPPDAGARHHAARAPDARPPARRQPPAKTAAPKLDAKKPAPKRDWIMRPSFE